MNFFSKVIIIKKKKYVVIRPSEAVRVLAILTPKYMVSNMSY